MWAEATKLGSCDKHPAYCSWNVDRAIFVWPWNMVQVKCSLFVLSASGWKDRSKHGLFVFPTKENLNMEKALFDWPIVLQYDVKAKYRLSFRKFSGMKFFHSSVRSTSFPERTWERGSFYPFGNQLNRSISVRLLFLFCCRVFTSGSYENRSMCLCAMVEMWCLSLIN